VNFGKRVYGLPTCWRAWCASCYRALPGEDFLIYRENDADSTELIACDEDDDYQHARPGNHLFCPFECNGCQFHWLMQCEPDPSSYTHQRLQIYIRRSILDAFWLRRPGTIAGLNWLFKQQVEVGKTFGFSMFDPLGPFERDYDSGIWTAIGILSQSQRPGHHKVKQKYSSKRKVRSLSTNVHNASARAALENLVWRSKKSRFVATTAPSDLEWHSQFMTGFHTRVGDRQK